MIGKNHPAGKLLAIVPSYSKEKGDAFVQIGSLWKTKAGNYLCNIEVEPVKWKDPAVKRTVLIEIFGSDEPNTQSTQGHHAYKEEDDDIIF